MDSQISYEFLDPVLFQVSITAVHLQRVVADSWAKLGGYFLGHGWVYGFVWVVEVNKLGSFSNNQS